MGNSVKHPPVNDRIARLRAAMEAEGLDALIISTLPNAYYFTGFDCSNPTLLITQNECVFLTDFRYAEAAQQDLPSPWRLVITSSAGGTKELDEFLQSLNAKRIGFEGSMSYDQFIRLKALVPQKTALIESGAIIRRLRAVKDSFELELIAKAQKRNEEVLASVLAIGDFASMTERELQKVIRREMIERGVEEAFPTIVAFNETSSRPHAVPGQKTLGPGFGVILVDMGVRENHYCSDMTRCFGHGTHEKLRKLGEIYAIVREAQEAALAAIRSGIPAREVDRCAREVISKAGYGQFFGHGLGHGVGIEIHEAPTLNPHSNDILETGMVITVEPGIYIPGLGGVRIEDLVVVEENGHRNLTSWPKDWQVLRV